MKTTSNHRVATLSMVCAVAAGLGAGTAARAGGCYAAAVDSGQQASTGSVTVVGSGCLDFGTRPDFNLDNFAWRNKRFISFRFDDFEAGDPVGGAVPYDKNGFYSQSGGAPWTVTDDALTLQPGGGPGVSQKFIRRVYTQRGNNSESGGLSVNVHGSNGTIYSTFKFMMGPNTQSGKIFRAYASEPTADFYAASGCRDFSVRGNSECNAAECSAKAVQWSSVPKLNVGVWHRVEVFASSGSVSVTVDGVSAWKASNWLSSAVNFNGHTLDFPNMIDSPKRVSALDGASCGTSGGSFNYDDIYVDFTPVRLEISDSSTWSGALHREIQPVTSWQAGRVEFALNLGELSASRPLYAYVISNGGPVSSVGIPVVIGGGAGGGVSNRPPSPPALKVN